MKVIGKKFHILQIKLQFKLIIDRTADINKTKSTSSLTKWLQRLLESHSKKTKERNVIDYFIYAIYTVLADTKKTRERIIS